MEIMTMTSGWRKPSNISYQGEVLIEWFEVGATATEAKMLPGMLVCKGANDGAVVENDGSGNPLGFIAYDGSWTGDDMPDDITDYYTRGSRIPIIVGGSGRCMGRLAASQTIVKGQLLKQSLTDGCLEAGTAGTEHIFAKADEAVTTAGGGAQTAIWVILP
jgi:hypothetical protein